MKKHASDFNFFDPPKRPDEINPLQIIKPHTSVYVILKFHRRAVTRSRVISSHISGTNDLSSGFQMISPRKYPLINF